MGIKINPEHKVLLDTLRALLLPGEQVYLVGGAVRDLLLGRPLHDLDFAMPDDPTRLAKSFARKLGVGFFVLDDERHTVRVVYHSKEGQLFPLDFVTFTGGSLIEDLRHRDFTVNAMALDIRDLETLIDPLGGQVDLKAGFLRLCHPRALLDDPVRVLRAARLALQFGWNFAPGLEDQIRQAAGRLPDTSRERQRDELFRILEGPEPAKGLEHCFQLDILRYLIPELTAETDQERPLHFALSKSGLQRGVLEKTESLLGFIIQGKFDDAPAWLVVTRVMVEPFMAQLRTYLLKEITPGRRVSALLLLAAMLQDFERGKTLEEVRREKELDPRDRDKTGAKQAWQIARRLALSNAESNFLRILIEHRDGLNCMVNDPLPPSRRAIYQFYQQTGQVGVAIVLLSIAFAADTYSWISSIDAWQTYLRVSESLLSAWWDAQDEVVNPPLLLDGNDLQRAFDLQPGARIGALLGALKEAQAAGEVGDKDQALEFIRKEMNR